MTSVQLANVYRREVSYVRRDRGASLTPKIRRAPLFFAASDVAIASDDMSVLVSFEDRVSLQITATKIDAHLDPGPTTTLEIATG